jgi:hypothetical protein
MGSYGVAGPLQAGSRTRGTRQPRLPSTADDACPQSSSSSMSPSSHTIYLALAFFYHILYIIFL